MLPGALGPTHRGSARNGTSSTCSSLRTAPAIVAQELLTLKDFPPRQKPGSFSVGDALDKLTNAQGGDN